MRELTQAEKEAAARSLAITLQNNNLPTIERRALIRAVYRAVEGQPVRREQIKKATKRAA
jgi:hypothetical protein